MRGDARRQGLGALRAQCRQDEWRGEDPRGHGAWPLYAVQLSVPDYRAAAARRQTRVLQQSHYDEVIAVAYFRVRRETFATASADGTIRIWDVNTYNVTCEAKCG